MAVIKSTSEGNTVIMPTTHQRGLLYATFKLSYYEAFYPPGAVHTVVAIFIGSARPQSLYE